MSTLRRWGGPVIFLGLLWLSPLRAEPLVDDPGRFTVDMPAPVERSSEAIDTNLGKGTLHTFMSEGSASTGYALSYIDYPPASKIDVAKSYEEIMKAQAESFKGSVRSKTEHKLGDVTGREFVIVASEGKLAARGAHLPGGPTALPDHVSGASRHRERQGIVQVPGFVPAAALTGSASGLGKFSRL